MKPFIIALLSMCVFTLCAYAQEAEKFVFPPPQDLGALAMTGEAQVDAVIDPLRIRLQDGRIIQLGGLDIPDLTPYDTGDIGATALGVLRELLVQKRVKIYQSRDTKNGRENRMGYQLAHLVEKNHEFWVQGVLLANGLARVRPSKTNTDMAAAMLALEGEARAQKRGLWADPRYAMLTPENAGERMNDWGIVEGSVRATAMAGNTIYLNFGPDWRTDFTVGIPSGLRRDMDKAGLNPLQLANHKIRVRGWVESYNGPYIELMNPAWIEVLPEAATSTNLDNN